MHIQTMVYTVHAHSKSDSHQLRYVMKFLLPEWYCLTKAFRFSVRQWEGSHESCLRFRSCSIWVFIRATLSSSQVWSFSLPCSPTLEGTSPIILPSWVTAEVVRESEVCAESGRVTECTRRARSPVRFCKTSTGSGTCIAHRAEGWRRRSCNWIHWSKCQA